METWEQNGVSNPAGFWIRVGAALLDGLIVGVPVGLLALIFFGGNKEASDVFTHMVSLLYGLLVPVLWSGYTVGKYFVGIRIVKLNGEPVSITTMLMRNVVTGLIYGLTLGIAAIVSAFMVGLREDKRALHDLIAGTYVTYDKPQA